MRQPSSGEELEQKILRDAKRFQEPINQDSELEETMSASDLNSEHLARARAVIGMGMEALEGIDKGRTRKEDARLAALGDLKNREKAAMAGATPERVERAGTDEQKWAALMEIVEGVDVENAGLDLVELIGISVSKSLLAHPKFVQKIILRQVMKLIRKEAGAFVRMFDSAEAEGIITALEKDTLATGIGYEANLVTESARSEAEARRNIEWYKAAIKRISSGTINSWEAYTGIAIKPTSIVAFSDSAIARPKRQEQLKNALCEILEVAHDHRLKDGKSVMITVDSERSDIFDMVGQAIIQARREFPKVRVGTAMQRYHRGTEELLLKPFLDEAATINPQEEEGLGIRVVGGANEKGEEQLHSAMGWFRGTPIMPGRHATHANGTTLGNLIMDPLKEGRINVTYASMNIFTLIDELVTLAKAGVFSSKNHGYISLAMLNNMTGPESFRHLRKFQAAIARDEGKFEKVPHHHQYIPVIDQDRRVELFKYYLRRIEELVGELSDGEIANFLGELAKYGHDSARFRQTQVRNGVVKALKYHQEHEGEPTQQINPSYRGSNEPLIIPDFATEDFAALRQSGIEVIPTSLSNFQISPALAPGAPKDHKWIDALHTECAERTPRQAPFVPLQLPRVSTDRERRKTLKLYGPTRPELLLGTYELATSADINTAFFMAKNERIWSKRTPGSRIETIINAIMKMRESRETLCKALIMNTGKPLTEADGEICETVDFFNLSALQMKEWLQRDNLEFETDTNGVEVVIGPKNFPIAIPAYQIVTALLNGERVIFKPSGGKDEESFEAGYELCRILWEAGVPKDALIFLPCDNKKAAELSAKADKLKLTGSAAVAEDILEYNEDLDLTAETGGPNVCVIDSTTDLKATATEIILSICQFGGQKCSKPIMIMLTEDANLEEFKTHLLSQMREMLSGNALTENVDNSGLTKSYNGNEPLAQKATNCLPGEEWLTGDIPIVQPDKSIKMETISATPKKMGDIGLRFITDPDNFVWSNLDEIFAPIATITQIKGGVEKAVDIINGLKGALTGSLFSQNRKSIMYARKHWKTGNLYFGRKCTAARADQGFGDGVGVAHYGAHGVKTGTPEYLIMGRNVKRRCGKYAKYDKDSIQNLNEGNDETGLAKALKNLEQNMGGNETLIAAMHAGYSSLYEHANYYTQNRPTPYQIKGQYDWIESHKVGKVTYRISPDDSMEDIFCKMFSTIASRNILHLSFPQEMLPVINSIQGALGGKLEDLFPNLRLQTEDDQTFAKSIEKTKPGCILYSDRKKVPPLVWTASREAKVYIDGRKATGDGRVDMITQYRQQSYCWPYHIAGDVNYEKAIRRNHPEWAPYPKVDEEDEIAAA